VPSNVEESRRLGILALGAEVVRSDSPCYDDTEAWAREEMARRGLLYLPAFDDEAVMAGNGGSLAAEVLEQAPQARAFVLPVGGGGLSAGFSFLARRERPGSLIVGCQNELSPALALSLDRGEAVTRVPAAGTATPGLEGGIGPETFEVLRSRIDCVALCSDQEILAAVRWLLEQHQYLVEPSGAVTVAACLTGKA
jgi:threonine dehydratase